MNEDLISLSKRIETLEKRMDSLAEYLKSALEYLSSDPQSSLTKCRIVLEKILSNLYIREMGEESRKGMIGSVLSDKEFSKKIPSRIRARMNFVREIANLGPHGGDVDIEDANHVLRDTVFLTEWYITIYDKSDIKRTKEEQYIEILPQLQSIYSDYLHPNIISVKLGYKRNRFYLEITKAKYFPELMDEYITRTDLGFVSGVEDWKKLYFDPHKSDAENASKFIDYFDEISIINCTDLFTEEASTRIYKYWNEHGITPSGKK